jgi:hypothetical protein
VPQRTVARTAEQTSHATGAVVVVDDERG